MNRSLYTVENVFISGEGERPHKKLEVWQKAMALVARIYELTNGFPGAEVYGLTSQMRRSAISVPSSIAEGLARKSGAEFCHFLSVAQGSLSELDTQLELASMLGYVDQEGRRTPLTEMTTLFKMFSGLIGSLKKAEQ